MMLQDFSENLKPFLNIKIMSEEKLASNFELNLIKIGVKRFQLFKGDRFVTNGAYFAYQPSTAENKAKLPFERYSRHTTISAEKHKKDVLRADNIKLVVDKQVGESTDFRWKEYEVQYAYTVPKEEREPLMCIVMSYDWQYVDRNKMDEKKFSWKISHTEMEIERETKVYVYVKNSPSNVYMNQVVKADYNKPQSHYGDHYIVCKLDDAVLMEDVLIKYVENLKKSAIESAKELVANATETLNKLLEFKKDMGY